MKEGKNPLSRKANAPLLNILAAANPKGHFYVLDFNPEHMANARQVMEEGGLANVTLLEQNFSISQT